MYPLLDHDDFSKSRKALVATATFLLIISHIEIISDTIELLGVKVKIDRTVVTGLGSIFLLYFIYAFIIRACDTYFSGRLKEVREQVTELKNTLETDRNFFSEAGHYAERMRNAIARIKIMSRLSAILVMVCLELIPPLLLAGFVAYKIDSFSAAKTFLYGPTWREISSSAPEPTNLPPSTSQSIPSTISDRPTAN